MQRRGTKGLSIVPRVMKAIFRLQLVVLGTSKHGVFPDTLQ